MSRAFATFIIPIAPTVIIPSHRAITSSIHSPIRSNPNNAISTNAVGLDILARAKKTPETMTYFTACLSNHLLSLMRSATTLSRINHDKIARIVMAITPRSVLLSTKTKNAPIPLVSQNSMPSRPKLNANHFSSSSFLPKKLNTSLTSPILNIITNIPLRKFIATAMVSADSQNRLLIGCIRLNQNEINICRKYGATSTGHITHRRTP